jgi:hypothetical protein
MANAFKVIDMVTKEALRVAHESSAFIATTDRQYDASFKDNGQGKRGATLRVREPNRYVSTSGRVLDVQDQNEASQTITVASQRHVGMRFNSVELVQSVNSGAAFDDLSKNYIEPAVKQLMSDIESEYITYATKAIYQNVGTAGTAITTLAVPGAARAKLNQALAPKDNRYIQMDSVTMGGLVNGMAAYFNPSSAIGDQYKEGLIARTAMADYYENERVFTQTIGSDITGVTLDTFTLADGGTAITVTGGAATVVGQIFTMAGVYDVHPETKVAYPHLKQFTLTSTSATAYTFSPPIQTTGAKKNASALPATTAAIVYVGAASASYVQPIMYHKEAFQFITADLPLMAGADKCVRKVQDGLSMRVWMDGDIRNDELLMRIDILYGMAALRPEWGCRMIGAANA